MQIGHENENEFKALVVDDSVVNRELVQYIMEQYGAKVYQAEDGAEAVALCQDESFSVILMDHHMNEMDGIEAVRRIRANGDTKVVIVGLTADVNEQIEREFLGAGCDLVMKKPVQTKELFRFLSEHLDGNEKQGHTDNMDDAAACAKDMESLSSACPELDVEQGMRLCFGEVETYYRILSLAVDSLKEIGDGLRRNMKLPPNEELLRLLHSLKGVLGNIGANGLMQEASRLYTEAKEKNALETEAFSSFLDRYDRLVHEILKHTKRSRRANFCERTDAEKEALTREAIHALDLFDYHGATSAVEALLQSEQGEKRELYGKVLDDIEHFAYQHASELLQGVK